MNYIKEYQSKQKKHVYSERKHIAITRKNELKTRDQKKGYK